MDIGFDVLTSTAILAGYAIPGFVLGVAMLVLFGGGSFLQWFPLRGLTSDNWSELSLIGKANWWLPSWLADRLPHFEVEGSDEIADDEPEVDAVGEPEPAGAR